MSFDPNNPPALLNPSPYPPTQPHLDSSLLTGPYGQPQITPSLNITPATLIQPEYGNNPHMGMMTPVMIARSPSPAPLARDATLDAVVDRMSYLHHQIRKLRDENHHLKNQLTTYQNHLTDLHTQLMLNTPKSNWYGEQLEYASARFLKYWPKDGKDGVIAKCSCCGTKGFVEECRACHRVRYCSAMCRDWDWGRHYEICHRK